MAKNSTRKQERVEFVTEFDELVMARGLKEDPSLSLSRFRT